MDSSQPVCDNVVVDAGQWVDADARSKAAGLVRALVDKDIDFWKFTERWPKNSNDPALSEILFVFRKERDGFSPPNRARHAEAVTYAMRKAEKFLQTDRPYTWPAVPGKFISWLPWGTVASACGTFALVVGLFLLFRNAVYLPGWMRTPLITATVISGAIWLVAFVPWLIVRKARCAPIAEKLNSPHWPFACAEDFADACDP